MVTIAAALLGIGYLLVYVAGSNLAHGPGHGVGFVEALGFAQTSPTPAQSRSPAPGTTAATTPPASSTAKPGAPGGKR